MDYLEKFIRDNRDDLDRYTPSKSIWRGISTGMRKRRPSLIIWLSAAAIITVIFGTAAFFFYRSNEGMTGYREKEFSSILMKTIPQLNETEIYYNNLVNDLYSKATPLMTRHPDIEKELNDDLSQLDSICADIKKDLKDNVANQEVIEALISNYRIKIRLLNEMLDLLKQNENNPQKTNSHAL